MAAIQPVYRLEVTAPDDADLTAVLTPQTVEVSNTLNEGAVLSATALVHHVGWLVAEDSATNPLQLNSYVTLKRARYTGTEPNWSAIAPIFRGRVRAKQLAFADGNLALSFHADSPLAWLKRTLASINGRAVGTIETPSVSLTAVTLYRVQNTGLPEFAYFPAPGTDAYLPLTFRPVQTTLSGNITNSDTTIEATTTHAGFLPAGLLQIGSEIIYYNGYQNDGTGDVYRFLNCTRGVLGTLAAGHLAPTVVDQLRPARMSPRRPFFLEKQITSSSVWVPLDAGFSPVDVGGYFQFDYDVMAWDGELGPFNANPRATYAVYDEDATARVSVGSVLRALLTESQAFGGPGWTETTDFVIDSALEDLTLVRFQVDEPLSTFEAMQSLFGLIGLELGDVDNAIVASEDATTGVITFALTRQKEDNDDPDIRLAGTITRQDAWSLDRIYSAVEVGYEEIRQPNLLSPDRCWHPALNQSLGTNGGVVKKIIWRDMPNFEEKAQAGLGWQGKNATASTAELVERIFDDNPNRSWGLQMDYGHLSTVGPPADALVCWFGDVTAGLPALQPVQRVKAQLDLGWSNNDTEPVHVQVLALTGSGVDISTDPPTYADADLSPIGADFEIRFENKPDDYGNMRRFQEIVLEADDVGLNMRGLIVRYLGMPDRKGPTDDNRRRTAAVTTLRVEGPRVSTVLIQTTASSGQDATYLYAPASHAKLRDATAGVPAVATIFVGPNTRETAIAIGRLWLVNALLLVNTYDVVCTLAEGLPLLGLDTVEVADAGGFNSTTGQFVTTALRGLAQEWTLRLVGGEETLRVVLRDYRRGLLQ